MRSLLALLLLVSTGLLVPHAATAQVLRGVVLEEGTSAPLEGAMVVVLDAGERPVARVLTDASGAFLVKLAVAGAYHVRVDRIGYASLTTDGFDVTEAGVFRRIVVPIRPVRLQGLDVSGAKRCEVRPEVGKATAVVWEEARKALQAAAWTLDSDQYRYRLLHFVRHMDRDGRNTLEEYRDFATRPGRVPYVSRPAQSLADSGYVSERTSGQLSYFAPDADVLLSDSFLDTHCMRLEQERDGLLGLAFEPVGGRKLPDIQGVLWLRAATADLERLEYRYTNLGRGPAAGDAGGEVRFGKLPDGSWIVRQWHVRMPLLQHLRSGRYQRSGYQEEGGIVWRAIDPEGATVYRAVTATVMGHFVDSLGAPQPGVTLRPRGLPTTAVSGSSGDWTLGELPEGQVKLDILAPFLDTLGLQTRSGPITVKLEEGQTLLLDEERIPGVLETVNGACGVNKPRENSTTLLGRVRTPDGAPAGGAGVRLNWYQPTLVAPSLTEFPYNFRAAPPGGPASRPSWRKADDPSRWLEATLDARGVFLFCGVPAPSQLRVVVIFRGRKVERVVDIPRGDPLLVTTLILPPGPVGEGR